jgi:hypothetical protein
MGERYFVITAWSVDLILEGRFLEDSE